MTQAEANFGDALHLHGMILPSGETRDLFIVDGCFTFQAPERYTTILPSGYLIPGLVDTHAHLALASPAAQSASALERVRASANAHLEAGVLAVREPGSPDYASLGIGPHIGLPRVVTAGQFLAPAGHYLENLSRDASEGELPAAAEEEARKSGAWAKVIGDWIDDNGRFNPNYSTGTLAEAARRVHAVGGRIAVHATTAASIESAIEAGFDSIEHGVGLSDEHIAAMAARGTVLVPTLIILPGIMEWMRSMGLPAHVLRPTLDALMRHPEMTRRAAETGIMVLAGTDAGMGPHGMVREEIKLLQAAGIPQEQALGAGSWIARQFLGFDGIAEGAPADVVAYPSDPRHDPEVLSRPALRILDGKVIGKTTHSH